MSRIPTPATIADQSAPTDGKGKWRACGIDPQGIDVVSPVTHGRINFDVCVTAPAGFWEAFEQLINQ